MGRRDELIARYAADLRDKCGVNPDMALLEKVALGCGPAIYDEDGGTIDVDDPAELATIQSNFLVRKLNLRASPDLATAIDAMIEVYGRGEPRKYRAVLYYLLVRHFGRSDRYRQGG